MQQAAELSVAAPTIEAALDGRFMSGLKDQRVAAAKFFGSLGATAPTQQPVCGALPCRRQHSLQIQVHCKRALALTFSAAACKYRADGFPAAGLQWSYNTKRVRQACK